MAIASINPANGETVETYREMTPQDTAAAIDAAHETWKSWRAVPFEERARLMRKTSAILRARKDALAKLMAIEMGKPLKQGVAEAEKCALACDYYADNAQAILAPQPIATEAASSYVA